MRLFIIAVLAAAALVAIAEASVAKMTAPTPPALIRSFTAAKYDTPTKRMLRTDNPYEVDEERAFGNRIVSAIKSWPSKIKMNSDLRTMLKKQQTADDALEFLKLNGGVDDLLSNPNLKNLAKYISKYNKKFPEARVTMTGTLSKKYGDDVVAAMLVAGQRSPNTQDIASKLQGEQFTRNPLKGDVYQAWRGYFNVYNGHAQLEDKTTKLKVLTDIYGERDLAAMLQKSKFDPESKMIATTFEREQFNSWVSSGVEPDTLFTKFFKLDSNHQLTGSDNLILDGYTNWWNAVNGIQR
ncbi:hypothetical protein ON010_g15148 [Phytophthora cinnamomi]|nr:hypothetical protein ON010_g15148 [Phytophthora cinnamomi]